MSAEIATEFDSKGRAPYSAMSDRELLIELVTAVRAMTDALEEVGKNPMLRAMMPTEGKSTLELLKTIGK